MLNKALCQGKREWSKNVANGYGGEQAHDFGEASARIYINEALEILAVTIDELRVLKKTDWRKAMIVRLLRANTSVKLDWISKELNMGARSGIGRAETLLKAKLERDKKALRVWRKLSK